MVSDHILGIGSFNPRSRVGSDSDIQCVPTVLVGFNPRSRVGSDRPESY